MTDLREKQIYRVTLIGTAVNAVLIVLKFIAGIFGRSSAMVADAVHSLTDFVTDIIVLIFVKIAGKPQDSGHDYGHGKFETFATMIIGLVLAVAGIGVLWNGVSKIVECLRGGELAAPTWLALAIAVVSIVSKEWLYRYSVRRGRELQSNAVVANAWHHRSDAISSLGTLVGIAGAMFLGSRWRILDPAAAVVVSFIIIKAGYDIMRPSVAELLESSLPEEEEKAISDTVLSVDGIEAIHHLRTRRIGNVIAIELHAKMDGSITLENAHTIATEAERQLKDRYGDSTLITIHMEPLRK
ncbi:MAG: cation transporter [Bacteroidales bacterium]|nr:cation transporter [Bacteroidales bacterium]